MKGRYRRAQLVDGYCDASTRCTANASLCCSTYHYCGSSSAYCSATTCSAFCPTGVTPIPFADASSSSPSPPPPPPPSSSQLSAGILAAIAVGAVAGVLLCVLLAFCCWRRWTRRYILRKGYERSLERASPTAFSEAAAPVEPFSPQQACVCYPLATILEATNNFDERLFLGKGGNAGVYKGAGVRYENWAIKRAFKKSQGRGFEDEVKLIRSLNHRHVVALLGWCADDNEEILIYEYVANGDLYRWLHGKRKNVPPLSFEQRVRIALGSAQGLAYIHEDAREPLVHRDVKSLNILLTLSLEAKVADFGISSSWEEASPAHRTHGISGTHGYLDPEYIKSRRVSPKLDIFSFGVVLLELITGREPLIEKGSGANKEVTPLYDWALPVILAKHVNTIVDPRLGDQYPPRAMQDFADLAAKCLSNFPTSRPDMRRVVAELDRILSSLHAKPDPGFQPSDEPFELKGLSSRETNSTSVTTSTFDFEER